VPASRPIARIAAVVLVGMVAAAVVLMLANLHEADWLGRFWHGLRPARISGTMLASLRPPTVSGESSAPAASAAPEPTLPPRSEARLPDIREAVSPPPPLPAVTPAAIEPRGPLASRAPAREVVVGAGDAFSTLVSRHYGRAELTLLDFVKTANPELTSIDVLQVGQRLRLPSFEPRALVQSADGSTYRLHLMTVWDTQSDVVQKLRASVTKRGRQVYILPVRLTDRDAAYRVMVGDFADRRDAEAFYESFRGPAGVTTQLWM
jgi:phage tail protein X